MRRLLGETDVIAGLAGTAAFLLLALVLLQNLGSVGLIWAAILGGTTYLAMRYLLPFAQPSPEQVQEKEAAAFLRQCRGGVATLGAIADQLKEPSRREAREQILRIRAELSRIIPSMESDPQRKLYAQQLWSGYLDPLLNLLSNYAEAVAAGEESEQITLTETHRLPTAERRLKEFARLLNGETLADLAAAGEVFDILSAD